MYKRWGRFSLALMIIMMLLFGACGQSQYEFPELTAAPKAEVTNTPAVEPTSTPEPSVTVVPTREVVPSATPTAVPEREEFFDDPVTPYPVETREPVATVVPVTPSPSPSPTPELEKIPWITGKVVVDERGVALENEWYSVKIVSLEENEQSDYVLSVQLENKSDRALCFEMADYGVNGADIVCFGGRAELESGQCATKEIVFDREALEEFSITEITGVVFELDVMDIGGRPYRMVAECVVFYYPQGESAYEPYHHVMTESDFFVGEDEGLQMVITGFEWDEKAEYYRMKVYFENKLDCPITIHLDDVFINGFQLEPWRYRTSTVGACRGRYDEFYLGAYVWELCGGEEITEFSFSVTAWSEDWFRYGYWDPPITVYPLGEDAAVPYEYVTDEDDITVFDTEDCRMVITNRGSVYGTPAVTVFLENKTEETLRFNCGGFWQDLWSEWVSWYSEDGWYTDLEAGRKLVTELKASDWNMTETEEGTKHMLSVTVSSGEGEAKRELLQEETEFVVSRTEE